MICAPSVIARTKQMRYAPEDHAGKPVITINSTFPDINPCHARFKERPEDIKRGVLQAGRFPLELRQFRCPSRLLSRRPGSIAISSLWRRRTYCDRNRSMGRNGRFSHSQS
jgi:Dehydratase family